jgi:UDP-N-acetyl-D-glucosamine/UDP-N-acetyl-D-galactosamine dehydrogenase
MRRRSISSPKVYGSLVTAGIHRTPSIQVAEAAKVIENTQRDLNIAFMNELSLSFRQSISTRAAAVATRSRQQEPNGISFPFSLGLPVATASASILITWLIEPRRPLPSRGYSGRPPHQRRNGASDCARMHPRLLRRKGRGGIVTILGVPFKGRAGYPQFTRDRCRTRTAGVRRRSPDRRSPCGSAQRRRNMASHYPTSTSLRPSDALIMAVAHDPCVEGGGDEAQSERKAVMH